MDDKDKYVVYTGIEDGAATFALFDTNYDSDRLVCRVTMTPEDVSDDTEYQDHFWVDLDESGEIHDLQFDPEFTKEKLAECQETVEIFRKMQENERERLNNSE